MLREETEDEMTMFDRTSLLDSGSSGRRRNPRKGLNTFALCGAFFGVGLSLAIPGPTLNYLKCNVGASLQTISYIFPSRSFGYLIGSIVGGFIFDKFVSRGKTFVSLGLIIAALSIVAAPWASSLSLLCILLSITSISMGFLDTGGNVILLRIWEKDCGPYMQLLHFAFGLGACISPLVAAPFLSSTGVSCNTTQVFTNTSLITDVAPMHKRQFIMPTTRSGEYLDLDSFPALSSTQPTDLSAKFNITTTSNASTTTDMTPNTTSSSLASAAKTSVTIIASTELPHKPQTGDVVSKDDGLGPASGQDLAKKLDEAAKGPPPLKSSTAAKPVPATPSVPPITLVNNSISLDHQNISRADNDSSVPDNVTFEYDGNLFETTSQDKSYDNVTDSELTTGLNVSVPAVVVTSATPSVFTTLTATIVTERVTEATKDSTTTATTKANAKPTTLTFLDDTTFLQGVETTFIETPAKVEDSAYTSTKQLPAATSIASTSPTTAPTTTHSTTTTATPHTTVTTTSSTTRLTTPISEDTATEPSLKPKPGKPVVPTKPPAVPETTTVTALLEKTTELLLKPDTNSTEDAVSPSFIEKTEELIMSISNVQFSYLVVSLVLLFFGFMFCFLNEKPDTISKRHKSENDLYEVAESMMAPPLAYRVKIMVAVFIFFFLYVGTEVTYGQFVATFSIHHNGFSERSGAYLTAIYWGMFALSRGASVPAAKFLSPTSMLTISIVITLCSIIGLTLATSLTNNIGALWVLSGALGVGMASIFPTGVLWLEGYIKVTSKMAAVFVCASALGEMIIPAVVGFFIEKTGPLTLMYTTLVCVIGCAVTFMAMRCIVSNSNSQYRQIGLSENESGGSSMKMQEFEFSDSESDSEPILFRQNGTKRNN